MWYGSTASVPTGWALCNGGNGTPNLVGRFIVAAGFGGTAGIGYNPGDQAGQNTTYLSVGQLPSHSHGARDLGHQHIYEAYVRNTGNNADSGGDISAKDNPNQRDYATSVGYANIQIDPTGSGQGIENRPTFYALCYIMKI